MLTFSATVVSQFKHSNPHLRYGQAFHSYMKLDRVTGADLDFCDKLYQEPNEELAKAMIFSRTDLTQ